MAKERTYKGKWTSDRAEAKFRDKEAVLWQRAKSPPDAIDVATRYGSTRAYRWPGAGAPVVLLHGMTDTSVRWIRFAEALEGHDVYAIDVMGELGHSSPDVGFGSADEYATWLDETLDALGLDRPHVVGYSLGGYIAFSYAMAPDRVRTLTAFDPVGVVELKLMRLISWSIRATLASFAPESIRRRLAEPLRQPLLTDKAEIEMLRASRGHPIKTPPCPEFTEAQLQSITAPVRVLVGADSQMFDVERMVERINTLLPDGEARLLRGAGHGLAMSHFDDCLELVRNVLEEPRVSPGA